MYEDNELTIKECAQIIFNLMYGKKKRDLLQAYATVLHKYKINYSYDEMKDYLFHHEMCLTEE